MKGVTFQKPLEFTVQVEGESWKQGDPIRGVLIVKNHGAATTPLSGIRVALAHAALSKVRQKSPKAFDVLDAVPMTEPAMLEPQAEAKLTWEFKTDRSFPITENSRSPFLLFGTGLATEKMGQLQLQIHPYALIQEILDMIGVSFRFVFKSRKFSKGWVEARLEPPTAKALGTINELLLRFHFDEDDQLQLRYIFELKKVEASTGVTVKTIERELDQAFTPDQYLLPNGRLNHDGMEAAFKDVLAQIAATPAW